MPNSYFQFKEFLINQANSGMKVTTDGCLFGAWVSERLNSVDPSSVLDIGAGTGLLSLMIAQKSRSEITAVEMDKGAFEECRDNFQNSAWSDRLNCFNGSIQTYDREEAFDFVISNPPYYKAHQKSHSLKKNLAQHVDSLNAEALLDAIITHLSNNGSAFVMYPEREFEIFSRKALKKGLHLVNEVQVFNESGKDVFRVFGEFSFLAKAQGKAQVVIRESNGQYTQAFRELLRDYYLNI